MAIGIPRLMAMAMGPIACGRMWLRTMRPPGTPMARAASMSSRCLSDRVWPRTRRAVPTHAIRPMATSVASKPLRIVKNGVSTIAAEIMMMNSRSGNVAMMSVKRMSAVSVLPPRQPAVNPTGTPIAITTSWATRATVSETRAPSTVRARRSRPRASVPSRWFGDSGGSGPWFSTTAGRSWSS